MNLKPYKTEVITSDYAPVIRKIRNMCWVSGVVKIATAVNGTATIFQNIPLKWKPNEFTEAFGIAYAYDAKSTALIYWNSNNSIGFRSAGFPVGAVVLILMMYAI